MKLILASNGSVLPTPPEIRLQNLEELWEYDSLLLLFLVNLTPPYKTQKLKSSQQSVMARGSTEPLAHSTNPSHSFCLCPSPKAGTAQTPRARTEPYITLIILLTMIFSAFHFKIVFSRTNLSKFKLKKANRLANLTILNSFFLSSLNGKVENSIIHLVAAFHQVAPTK